MSGGGAPDLADSAAPLLRFERVACVRGGRLLFRGINFTLSPGELLWLRGDNGAGKSSLIRLAAGLLRPEAGVVTRGAALALADEHPALDRETALRPALMFWARVDGADHAAVDRALAAMAMDALADVPVRLLSTGQRRRAGLARVMASAAPLWLLDEPANGLDSASQHLLEAAIAAHRAAGGAVLMASHQDVAAASPALLTLERLPSDAAAMAEWEA